MSVIDPEVRRVLDLRLARGEIQSEEYRRLLGVLSKQEDEGRAKSTAQDKSESELLLAFEDLLIYSTHIVVDGQRKELANIAYVDGGSSIVRINLLPAVKHTSLIVQFTEGGSFCKDEQRTLFGGKRHKALAQAVHLLKKLTFRSSLDALCRDVQANPVQIGIESDAPFDTVVGLAAKALSSRRPAPIYLRCDGSITNGTLTFDLKQCRSEGVLELGIYRTNLSEPDSVYACEKKSLMERSHRQALRFGVQGKHRSDVVMALLNWMATPGNRL